MAETRVNPFENIRKCEIHAQNCIKCKTIVIKNINLKTTAALWVRIQTSLKNTKWATQAKEWPTHCSPPTNIYKKNKFGQDVPCKHQIQFLL